MLPGCCLDLRSLVVGRRIRGEYVVEMLNSTRAIVLELKDSEQRRCSWDYQISPFWDKSGYNADKLREEERREHFSAV
jgi:hypothetical protein